MSRPTGKASPADNPARRDIEFALEPIERKLKITYNPENIAGSRTELEISPWCGSISFVVDESEAAGVDAWFIEVTIAQSEDGELHIRYALPREAPVLA